MNIFNSNSLKNHIATYLNNNQDQELQDSLRFVCSTVANLALDELAKPRSLNRIQSLKGRLHLPQDYPESFRQILSADAITDEQLNNFILSFPNRSQLFETFQQTYLQLVNESKFELAAASYPFFRDRILPGLEKIEHPSTVQRLWGAFSRATQPVSLEEELSGFLQKQSESLLPPAVKSGDDGLFQAILSSVNRPLTDLETLELFPTSGSIKILDNIPSYKDCLVKALKSRQGIKFIIDAAEAKDPEKMIRLGELASENPDLLQVLANTKFPWEELSYKAVETLCRLAIYNAPLANKIASALSLGDNGLGSGNTLFQRLVWSAEATEALCDLAVGNESVAQALVKTLPIRSHGYTNPSALHDAALARPESLKVILSLAKRNRALGDAVIGALSVFNLYNRTPVHEAMKNAQSIQVFWDAAQNDERLANLFKGAFTRKFDWCSDQNILHDIITESSLQALPKILEQPLQTERARTLQNELSTLIQEDFKKTNQDKRTPIHVAAYQGEAVKAVLAFARLGDSWRTLLQDGLKEEDRSGKTPIRILLESRTETLKELIQSNDPLIVDAVKNQLTELEQHLLLGRIDQAKQLILNLAQEREVRPLEIIMDEVSPRLINAELISSLELSIEDFARKTVDGDGRPLFIRFFYELYLDWSAIFSNIAPFNALSKETLDDLCPAIHYFVLNPTARKDELSQKLCDAFKGNPAFNPLIVAFLLENTGLLDALEAKLGTKDFADQAKALLAAPFWKDRYPQMVLSSLYEPGPAVKEQSASLIERIPPEVRTAAKDVNIEETVRRWLDDVSFEDPDHENHFSLTSPEYRREGLDSKEAVEQALLGDGRVGSFSPAGFVKVLSDHPPFLGVPSDEQLRKRFFEDLTVLVKCILERLSDESYDVKERVSFLMQFAIASKHCGARYQGEVEQAASILLDQGGGDFVSQLKRIVSQYREGFAEQEALRIGGTDSHVYNAVRYALGLSRQPDALIRLQPAESQELFHRYKEHINPKNLVSHVSGILRQPQLKELLSFYLTEDIKDNFDPITQPQDEDVKGLPLSKFCQLMKQKFPQWSEIRELATFAKEASEAQTQKDLEHKITEATDPIYKTLMTQLDAINEASRPVIRKALLQKLSPENLRDMGPSEEFTAEEIQSLSRFLQDDGNRQDYEKALNIIRRIRMVLFQKGIPAPVINWIGENFLRYDGPEGLLEALGEQQGWRVSVKRLYRMKEAICDNDELMAALFLSLDGDALQSAAKIHREMFNLLKDHDINYRLDHATPLGAIEDHRRAEYMPACFDAASGNVKMMTLVKVLENEKILQRKAD